MRDEMASPVGAYSAYTPIRAVGAPDSPLPGSLARGPDGRTVLLVDRADLADWAGWSAQPESHVLAPIDIVRRVDGHDVVVPMLAERADRFLQRRDDADAPLSAGEALTMGVSAIRGLSETLRAPDDAPGEWWLTDEGRPVLVEGCGGDTARRATSALCTRLAAQVRGTRLASVLDEIADAAIDARAFARDAQMWEDDLFACASAEPLATEVFGPLRARVTPVAASEDRIPPDPAARPWWAALAFHLDANLSDTVSDAIHGVLRRLRSSGSKRARGRAWLWAGGVAAVVVVGGLLWPTGDNGEMAAAPAESPPSPAAPALESPQPSSPETTAVEPPSAAPVGDDLVVATEALLEAHANCTSGSCRAAILEDPTRVIPPGPVDAAPGSRTVTLVDDFGGVAVLRVERTDGSPAVQLVTVVETREGWRIRDVIDVADPPP